MAFRTFLFILLANTSWGQQASFLNYSAYGFTNVLLAPDHNLIAIGKNFTDNGFELWKLTPNGDVIWHKVLPIFQKATLDNLSISNDQNYLICGRFIQTPSLTKLIIFKVSPEGNIIWAAYPEVSKSLDVDDIFQLPDNSFVLTGTSGNYGEPYYSLLHLDSTASNELGFTQHLVETDTLLTNWQSPYGSYLSKDKEHIVAICADNVSGSNINSDSYVMKFTSSGQLVWKEKLDYGERDVATCITALKDNSIAACGYTNQFFSIPLPRAFLTKLNDDGTILWERFYDSTGIGAGLTGADILELKNGDLLITGVKLGSPNYDILMLLVDSMGNEKNRIVLERDDHNDSPAAMVLVENNMVAIAGHQDGYNDYKNLLVLFPLSLISTTKDLIVDSPIFDVYPNPVGTELNLHYEQIESSNLQLEIFSNLGEKVFSGSSNKKMDLNFYPAGIYYFILIDSKTSKSFVRKVVKGI